LSPTFKNELQGNFSSFADWTSKPKSLLVREEYIDLGAALTSKRCRRMMIYNAKI
jgi:hypothetical protein